MTYLSDSARSCMSAGCGRRTAIIRAIDMHGFADDTAANGMGDGMSRVGRHIISWDDRGFHYLMTYCNDAQAIDTFETYAPDYDCEED